MQNASILVVGNFPGNFELMWVSLATRHSVQVQSEGSPETALESIERKTFSLISFDDSSYKSGDIGRQFLKKCRRMSPLSSRILYSSFHSVKKMKALVASGEITSYVPSPFELDSVLSANAIALEAHKINRMGSLLFTLDFESAEGIDKSLSALNAIVSEAGWDDRSKVSDLEFEDRELELGRLALGAKAVAQTISGARENLALLFEGGDKGAVAKASLKKTDQIKRCLDHIYVSLASSKIFLERNHQSPSVTANMAIADTDAG